MSTPSRHSTPSPTKRLTPVVEVTLTRSRSSVKRTSVGHGRAADSEDAKRARRDGSFTYTTGASVTRPEMSRTPSARQGTPFKTMGFDELRASASPTPSPRASPVPEQRLQRPTVPSMPQLIPSAKKPFVLPGQQRASRRKIGNISDLMGRATPGPSKDVDLGFDHPEEHVGSGTETTIARETASTASAPVKPPFSAVVAGNRAENASTVTQVENPDVLMVAPPPPHTQSPVASRLPSPSASASTASTSQNNVPPTIQNLETPTKTRRTARLATPSSSSKKRTPTKAIKRKPEEGEDGLLSAPQSAIDLFPTPSATPERSPKQTSSYPPKDILELLEKVLRQLSSPCAGISGSNTLKPTDPSYKTWLASQPCLSPSHAAAEKDVRNTLDRTIRDGEGNCMLIIGERGIGKSAIVERSLKTLQSVHGKDAFLVVKLSGLVQRDDKAAVREIARQLCSSSYSDEVEEGSSFNSNANILSSLLAILEPGQSDDPEEVANEAKPLIFIIDEFDLFAHSAMRQSMLYCLLDCVQGGFRRGGMAVFGLSARADCFESLEKRVKSRCQSRVHHILPAEELQSGTMQRAKEALRCQDAQSDIHHDWNETVETFFSDKTVQLQLAAMNDLRGLDADRKLFDALTIIIARRAKTLSRSYGEGLAPLIGLQASDLTTHIQLAERAIPPSLNMAELALLIACKHLTEEEKPVNFVIAYERYIDHSKRAAASGTSSSRAFSRGLCLRAFESLKKFGLLKEVSPSGKQAIGGGGIFRLCRLVPWPFMIEEAVKARKDIPQHLAKWCKAWSD